MKSNINIEKIITNILYLILILNIVSMTIFIVYTYKYHGFNSDSAVRVILAKEIYESGNYFPKDWFFVNGDIWVLSAHTIIIPLLRYFPAGYSVYAFASLVMSALILMSISALLDIIETEKKTKLLILVIFTSGISLAVTENVYGQISYGFILMYYCLIMYGNLAVLNKNNKNKLINSILVFSLLLIIFWSNPLRGIVFFVIPLVMALSYYALLCYKKEIIKAEYKYIKFIVFIMISMIIGLILNRTTLDHVQMNNGVTQLQWLSLTEMIRKIPKIIASLLFILGGEPYANRSLFTISGIYDGFRLIVALCFIILVPLTIRKIFKEEANGNIKLFIIFVCCAFTIIAFLMITTNIYNARYLLPATVLMVIIVYVYPFNFKNNPVFDSIRILTIVGFMTNNIVINTGYWATYYNSEAHKDDSQTFNNINKLAQYMQSINLNYGYATFWNAGALTVLSDNTIQTRQIYIENGIPQKFKWLSSNRWYMQSDKHKKTFILLTKQESETLNWKILSDEYKLMPESEMNFEDYKIYIFNENISNKLSNWKY